MSCRSQSGSAGHLAHTHGETYTEPAQKGQELLEFLVESAREQGDTMPAPGLFDDHAYKPGETAESIAAETQQLLRDIEQTDSKATA